jgi:N6-adenosine-specific RNA methylase IME4
METCHSIRSVLEAPGGAHSEKPQEFYDLVERFHPGPYVELFARVRRDRWVCLGDGLDGDA